MTVEISGCGAHQICPDSAAFPNPSHPEARPGEYVGNLLSAVGVKPKGCLCELNGGGGLSVQPSRHGGGEHTFLQELDHPFLKHVTLV